MESQGHTIAIVDEGSSERASLSRMLSLHGYRVEPFSTAADFFRAAPASEASCLIIDIRRGKTSGLELVRQLAADGFKFPVIFIGNSDDDLNQMRFHEVSCAAYLQKPYSESRLIDAIAMAIGSKPK